MEICQCNLRGVLHPFALAREEVYDGVAVKLRLPARKCLSCGEIWLGKEAAQAEISQIAQQLGRLSGEEIRRGLAGAADTSRLGIDRADLEQISRGRLVPTAEQDAILRILFAG